MRRWRLSSANACRPAGVQPRRHPGTCANVGAGGGDPHGRCTPNGEYSDAGHATAAELRAAADLRRLRHHASCMGTTYRPPSFCSGARRLQPGGHAELQPVPVRRGRAACRTATTTTTASAATSVRHRRQLRAQERARCGLRRQQPVQQQLLHGRRLLQHDGLLDLPGVQPRLRPRHVRECPSGNGDPHGGCAPNSECGNTGVCNGSGSCTQQPTTVACGSPGVVRRRELSAAVVLHRPGRMQPDQHAELQPVRVRHGTCAVPAVTRTSTAPPATTARSTAAAVC